MQIWRVYNDVGHIEFTSEAEAEAYALANGLELIELINRESEPPSQTAEPDWEALLSSIRGTPIFAKAYASGDYSLSAQNALTQLMNAIAVTHELVDFTFFFNRLRETMAATPVGDYTGEELGAIASILQTNHFSLEGLNLD